MPPTLANRSENDEMSIGTTSTLVILLEPRSVGDPGSGAPDRRQRRRRRRRGGRQYAETLKTPFLGALVDYAEEGNQLWTCPGHNGEFSTAAARSAASSWSIRTLLARPGLTSGGSRPRQRRWKRRWRLPIMLFQCRPSSIRKSNQHARSNHRIGSHPYTNRVLFSVPDIACIPGRGRCEGVEATSCRVSV
jgi:hypothetical protein